MTIPGGHSTISYLQKVRDGVVFSENFENDNFLTAEGWTTLQGTPANTSDQYVDGIKSWDNSATSQSLPIAKKVINETLTEVNWKCQVWFYDDVTKTDSTTYPGPYFKIKRNDGKFASVGVRNSITTSNYSYSVPNVSADAPDVDSGVARSTGWKSFLFVYYKGVFRIFINSTNIYSNTQSRTIVSEIYLNSNTVGGSNSSFGYFDNVGYFKGYPVLLHYPTSTRRFKLYDSNNLLVQTVDSTSAQTVILEDLSLTTLLPNSCYLEISKEDEYGVLEYRSSLLNLNPGDIYEYHSIDLGRKFTSLDVVPTTLADKSETKQGVQAVETYGLKNRHAFNIEQLEDLSWKQEAENFFYWVREGEPFAVNVDNLNEIAFGVISKFIPDSNSELSIMNNLSTLATDNFEAGQRLIVQNKANTNKQDVTVASVDTNSTLTLNERLNFDLNSGDYIYSQFHFPWQELPADNLAGFKQVNAQDVRYSWTLPCSDFNGDI